jgi:glutaredoxin
MENVDIIVYTMKGCPYCVQFKELLETNSIEYFDRDIEDYKDEYDLYTKITKNDMIPALMVIENAGDTHRSYLYAPERDYKMLDEALEIVKKHKSKVI